MRLGLTTFGLCVAMCFAGIGCGDDSSGGGGGSAGTGANGGSGNSGNGGSGNGGSGNSGNGGSGTGNVGNTFTGGGPDAGNPDGNANVPSAGQAVDTSNPTTVVGDGTPESCTSDAFISAVEGGGIITFNCGDDPVTITTDRTAKIFNDSSDDIVIDGGGKVTLSGGGAHRILYMNTCDKEQHWTSDHCNDQETPRLTVQNITMVEGNSTGQLEEGGGGGAIFVRGGQFKVVNSRFFNNTCDSSGPDLGGAALRVLSQYQGNPVYVVHSTFGGAEGYGNICSNGAGLSSIGVSWTVINSLFTHNKAIGNGANPAQSGTPGGGSGGAIYNDGTVMTLTLMGTKIEDNTANEGGGAIFFVSNDVGQGRKGHMVIQDSELRRNPSGKFETKGFPGIFVLAAEDPQVTNSTLE